MSRDNNTNTTTNSNGGGRGRGRGGPPRSSSFRRRTFTGGTAPKLNFDIQSSVIDEMTTMNSNSNQDAINELMSVVNEQSNQIQSLQSMIQSLQSMLVNQNNEVHTLKEEVRNLERWAVLAAPIPGWGENKGFTNAMQEFIANFKRQIVEMTNYHRRGNNSRSHSRGQICFNAPDG